MGDETEQSTGHSGGSYIVKDNESQNIREQPPHTHVPSLEPTPPSPRISRLIQNMQRLDGTGDSGDDSDDDGEIKDPCHQSPPRSQSKSKPQSRKHIALIAAQYEPSQPQGAFEPFGLEKRETCPKDLKLCPFKLVSQYPYRFVGKSNGEKVAEYFKTSIFDGRIWDMFYIHDPCLQRDPLILVPTAQFEHFLDTVNAHLGVSLSVPKHGKNSEMFQVVFEGLGLPRPRFTGRITTESMYTEIKKHLGNADDNYQQYNAPTLQCFKGKMDDIYKFLQSPRRAKKDPEKKRQSWIQTQKTWGRTTKRVQRYLGLRTRTAYNSDEGKNWNANLPPPFRNELSVRFVCVDVEAYERNHSIVTEIGIAILDTDDIIGVAPGERGQSWFSLIETHHLRVKEVSDMVNHEFVKGCPEFFDFGESEFVSQKHLCERVTNIIENSGDTSPLVMVGHDISIDLKYLKAIGFDIWRKANFFDEVDTKTMFQRVQRSRDPRGLEHMCSELDIPGHNFHNAGNDAVHTLRAMVAMALLRKTGYPDIVPTIWNPREIPNEAEWSDGEDDDGGSYERSLEPVSTSSSTQANSLVAVPGTARQTIW